MRTRITALLLLLLAAPAVAISDFWAKKDFTRWSERECRKLLEDSPWAKRYTMRQILIEPLQTDSTERAREQQPQIEYQVQLRSARPLRQAMVRLSQIQNKYDKMTPEQRQAFDAQAEEFLSAEFPDTILVYVAYGSNVQFDDRDLARHWQTQTTETLRNFVYLIGPEGQKIPLLRYVVAEGGGRAFQFIFPRQFEGRPLLEPGDKSLKIEFPHPDIRGQGEARIFLEFKVEKMIVNGEVEY